jgi:hypothetical protein
VATRSRVVFPHSLPSAAESVRGRRSDLTPIAVMPKEPRAIRTAAARPLAVTLPCVSERTPHARELRAHALMAGESAMMGGWKTVRTRASVTRRSSGAPKGFVSALPSRLGGLARETSGNSLTPLKRGEGCGGRIDYAAAPLDLTQDRAPLAMGMGPGSAHFWNDASGFGWPAVRTETASAPASNGPSRPKEAGRLRIV